jgi:hypothetical protein
MWWLIPAGILGLLGVRAISRSMAPGMIDKTIENYRRGLAGKSSLIKALAVADEIKDEPRKQALMALLQ